MTSTVEQKSSKNTYPPYPRSLQALHAFSLRDPERPRLSFKTLLKSVISKNHNDTKGKAEGSIFKGTGTSILQRG